LSDEQAGQLGALMAESAQMYKAAAEASESDDDEAPVHPEHRVVE